MRPVVWSHSVFGQLRFRAPSFAGFTFPDMTDGDWGQQMKCSTQNVHFCSDFNTLAHVKHFGGFLRGGSGMGGGYKEYFYINTGTVLY